MNFKKITFLDVAETLKIEAQLLIFFFRAKNVIALLLHSKLG